MIAFSEAIMRREWTRLERGDTERAWRNSQATFSSQIVGPHFESLCRAWAAGVDENVFGDVPGEVATAAAGDDRLLLVDLTTLYT